jgi:hypothetical protein
MRVSRGTRIVATFAVLGPPIGAFAAIAPVIVVTALTDGGGFSNEISELAATGALIGLVGYAIGLLPALVTGIVMALWASQAATENWMGRAAGVGFITSGVVATVAWAILIGTSSAGVGGIQLFEGSLTMGLIAGTVGAASGAICAALARPGQKAPR